MNEEMKNLDQAQENINLLEQASERLENARTMLAYVTKISTELEESKTKLECAIKTADIAGSFAWRKAMASIVGDEKAEIFWLTTMRIAQDAELALSYLEPLNANPDSEYLKVLAIDLKPRIRELHKVRNAIARDVFRDLGLLGSTKRKIVPEVEDKFIEMILSSKWNDKMPLLIWIKYEKWTEEAGKALESVTNSTQFKQVQVLTESNPETISTKISESISKCGLSQYKLIPLLITASLSELQAIAYLDCIGNIGDGREDEVGNAHPDVYLQAWEGPY